MAMLKSATSLADREPDFIMSHFPFTENRKGEDGEDPELDEVQGHFEGAGQGRYSRKGEVPRACGQGTLGVR